MKYTTEDAARPALVDIAEAVVVNAVGPTTIVDGSRMADNLTQLRNFQPQVRPAVAIEDIGDHQELATLFRDLEVDLYSVKNRVEIEKALKMGIAPEKLAFINPIKPGAQIKFALSKNINVIGCGSANEVAKVTKASRQLGLEKAAKVVVVLDVENLLPFPALMEILNASTDVEFIGVSLFGGEESSLEAFTKAVAAARLLLEVATNQGQDMKVLDVGEIMLDEEEKWKTVSSQTKAVLGLQIVAHAGQQIMRGAVGMALQIQAVRQRPDYTYFSVNESIYQAFTKVLAGVQIEKPVLISNRNGAKTTCNIFGNSGDDCDVIKSNVQLCGGSTVKSGDWILFPNICGGSLRFASTPDAWKSSGSDVAEPFDLLELENLFRLPDLTEQSLECMFNI